MLKNKGREAVIQNLRDAGCNEKFVENFLLCYDGKDSVEE